MKKICVICGKEFVLKNNRAHNRRICYNEHYYKCDYCGKEFVLSEQQSQQLARGMNKKFFCSLSCSSKYGNETRDMKKVIEKMNKTCLEKYGVVGYNNRNKFAITSKQGDIWIKSHLTKKENGTYGKSIQEDIFYNYVKQNTDLNIERQVLIDSMSFDFKINNILVELNGNYFHNYKLFTNTEQDLQKYNNLKLQGGQKATIADTWRYRDTEKLNYCKENNILLLVVYFDNIEDILQSILNCLKTVTNTTILRFNKNTLVEKQVLNSGNIDTVFNTTNKYYNKNIINTLQNEYENSSISLKQLSENYNIPKGTVQSWKQKYNWTKKEQYLKEYKQELGSKFEKSNINDKDVQQIKYLYENTNLSVKEIGEQLNMTVDMVRNRINKYGFKRTKEQISRIMSEKQKSRWNNYTEERQEEIKQKMSKTNKEVWANRDIDKKQEIIQHRLNTINNKSEKELQKTRNKISQSVQKTWDNYNKEDRLIINKKLQKIWSNRTPEEKEQFKITMQNTWKIKTAQQIKELEEKRKLCYKNKSKEEMNSINNKIHQTKKLKGVYGKSNQEDKLYKELVKEFGKENVERQYTENGFVFDFKIIRPSLNPRHKGELIEQLVEFNGSFFHNFRPFINCLEHNKEYNVMCNKGLIISRIAHKWKYTDVEKFLYCKLNNKNYTAIYFDTNPKPYFTQEELKTSYKQILKQPLKYTNLSTHNEIVENFCYKEIYKDNLQKFKQDDIYKYLVNRIKYANNYGESCSNITLLQLLKDFNKSGSILNGFTMFPITNIRKFIYDNNVKTIADPFAGWGHRLIGSYSMNCNYIGCDINPVQINNLYSITQFLNQQNNTLFKPNIVLLNNDSLNVDTSLYNYDAIFTCPPYWNKEIYTDKGVENLTYKEFKQKFIDIIKTWIIPSVKIIGIQFTEKYEDCIKDLGYKYEKIVLNNVTHHFTKNNKKYFECLYIIKL